MRALNTDPYLIAVDIHSLLKLREIRGELKFVYNDDILEFIKFFKGKSIYLDCLIFSESSNLTVTEFPVEVCYKHTGGRFILQAKKIRSNFRKLLETELKTINQSFPRIISFPINNHNKLKAEIDYIKNTYKTTPEDHMVLISSNQGTLNYPSTNNIHHIKTYCAGDLEVIDDKYKSMNNLIEYLEMCSVENAEIVYDLDNTLLLNAQTAKNKQTTLNKFLIDFTIQLKKCFPNATYYTLSSRKRNEDMKKFINHSIRQIKEAMNIAIDENKEADFSHLRLENSHPISTESIVAKFSKQTQIIIENAHFTNIEETGQLKADYLLDLLKEREAKPAIIVVFDDNIAEIENYSQQSQEFKQLGVELIIIQCHYQGDFVGNMKNVCENILEDTEKKTRPANGNNSSAQVKSLLADLNHSGNKSSIFSLNRNISFKLKNKENIQNSSECSASGDSSYKNDTI